MAELSPTLPEDRYRRIYEDNLCAHAVTTEDGVIEECNPAFARTFGYRSAELAVGQPAGALYPDPRVRRTLWERLEREGRLELEELTLRRLDGKPVRILANIVGEQGTDGALRLHGYFMDITPRHELACQLVRAQRQGLVGQLASGFAHDLNNYLTLVMGNLALARMRLRAGSEEAALLETAAEHAGRAANLGQRLLGFSREGAAGVDGLKEIPGDQLLERVARLGHVAMGRRLGLTVERSATLPRVLARAEALEQVVLNLLLNAREATGRQGSVRLEAREVELGEELGSWPDAVPAGRWLRLSVRDDGHGIPEALRHRVFEPFFTTKEEEGGTGLGLAMVRRICAEHGAPLELRQPTGGGSEFALWLPAVA